MGELQMYLSLFFKHCHSKAAYTNQLISFIFYAYIPYMRGGAEVQGGGGGGNEALPDAPDMITVDFHADTDLFFFIDTHPAGHAAHGLGECRRSAPVQQAVRLMGIAIDGHTELQKIGADFGKFHG